MRITCDLFGSSSTNGPSSKHFQTLCMSGRMKNVFVFTNQKSNSLSALNDDLLQWREFIYNENPLWNDACFSSFAARVSVALTKTCLSRINISFRKHQQCVQLVTNWIWYNLHVNILMFKWHCWLLGWQLWFLLYWFCRKLSRDWW